MEELKRDWNRICMVLKKYTENSTLDYAKAFIVGTLLFGILYSIILTPNTIFDEIRHYASAYRYSNVFLYQRFSTDNGNFQIRSEDMKIFEYSECYGREMLKRVKRDLFLPSDPGNVSECNRACYGNLIQYIPQALGITFGRLLHLGYLPVFYLGRLCNLLAYILLGWMAIRKIPFGKMVILLVAMLPISIHQAASYSYDAVLNGVSFYFIAYVFSMAFTELAVQKKDIAMLCVLAAVLGAYKGGVYIFLCGLLILIPAEKFKSRKAWFLTLGLIIASFFVMMFSINYGGIYTIKESGNLVNEKGEPLYQLSYLIKNPFLYFLLIFNTLRRMTKYFIFSPFGGYLSGCVGIEVQIQFILGFILLIIYASFKPGKEPLHIKGIHKVWFASIIAILFSVIAFAFIISWTPQGSKTIWGMQGRYFVPVLPLLFFMFRNERISRDKNTDKLIFYSACILQFLVVIDVYLDVLWKGDAIRNIYNL